MRQLIDDPIEPWPAIVIRERCPRRHLGYIRRRMKVVRVVKRPTERCGQRTADLRFATAANAHQHDDHDFAPSELCTGWPPKLLRIIARIFCAYSLLP